MEVKRGETNTNTQQSVAILVRMELPYTHPPHGVLRSYLSERLQPAPSQSRADLTPSSPSPVPFPAPVHLPTHSFTHHLPARVTRPLTVYPLASSLTRLPARPHSPTRSQPENCPSRSRSLLVHPPFPTPPPPISPIIMTILPTWGIGRAVISR